MDFKFNVHIKPREQHKCSSPIFGYLYRIKDTLNRKSYIGIRYAKGIDINNDLGVKYFGSSQLLSKQISIAKKPERRFLFEIRRIFNAADGMALSEDRNSDSIVARDTNMAAQKNIILLYESRLLRKLKAGKNPRLYNLYSSYEHYLNK